MLLAPEVQSFDVSLHSLTYFSLDHQHTNKTLKRPLLKYYTLITGSMSGHEASIERDLKKQIPGLQKVQKLEECDFILVFCPVVSRAGTNLDAAVKRLSTQPGKTSIMSQKNKKHKLCGIKLG